MSLFTTLLDRTADDAGCAVWQKSCCNGHPAMRQNDKTVLVRRAVWIDMHGPIPAGKIIRMTCETPKCIHPDHMAITTHQKLAKENGAKGLMSGPVRSAKIAATKRAKHAKLTNADVLEIRSSPEKGRAMAAKHGVDEKHISRIRRHQCWRDFSNPFAGIFTATL